MNTNTNFLELISTHPRNEIVSKINNLAIENSFVYQSILQQAIALRNIDIELSTLLLMKAEEANYGEGRVFTELCFNNFKLNNIQHFENSGISCSMLGSYGRFGNQLLQFFTMIGLSEILHLPIYTPQWIGNFIFNIKADQNMPIYNILKPQLINEIFERKISAVNFDIGTYMADIDHLKSFRSRIIDLMKLNLNLLNELNEFGFQPESSLVIHLRLTDFTTLKYNCDYNIIFQYVDNYIKINNPENIWLVTDDISSLDIFNKNFNIKSLNQYKKKFRHIDFLYDWQILLNSYNVVANSESTFSLTANFLSPHNQNLFCLSQNGSSKKINYG